ncbi:hypothetical protein GSY74_08365 [Sulfurovum sp. bin170]|uniref:caspase family protein n=1 Tax=Sulfurovum sp. bin170 TaxID=2695268 RepID=UPI0013DED95A|nr:caspase family protein [Sulfurovum sp. bin170]NEW61295.1 hypothetical protein [Sulfurovum sp. bin170]
MKKSQKILSFATLSLIALSLGACASGATNSQSKGLSVGSTTTGSTTLFSKNIVGKKQALVVGVSDYAGESADLGGIERDVNKMKRLFEGWGFEVKTLYDRESIQIVDYLSQYGENLGSDDYFAFYYSGHGSHKPDSNGDEADGEDETLVLSDGRENTHLIDDILYAKFNGIKAKKMIFFDSCHSGTVFRSLNGKSQPKTISPNSVTKSFSKGLSIGGVTKKSDTMDRDSKYIVFSSSQDDEESLATPTGSLFTNSIYEIFSDKSSQSKSFDDIGKILTSKVLAYAKESEGTPHHPSISFSKSYSNSDTFQNFVGTKSTASNSATSTTPVAVPSQTPTTDSTLQNTLETLMNNGEMKRMNLSYNKTSYNTGESVEFSLDTGGDRGYLTIFYVDSNDVTLLYPNPFVNSKEIQGRYSFPKDLSGGKFELEAYKGCNGCQEEKTVIYTLLSSKPILDASAIRSRDGLTSFARKSSESQIMTRAVRVKAVPTNNSGFKPQLGKYEFIVR